MTKQPTSIRLPSLTSAQLSRLISLTGTTQSEVITIAIDRMYTQEMQTMSSQTIYLHEDNGGGLFISNGSRVYDVTDVQDKSNFVDDARAMLANEDIDNWGVDTIDPDTISDIAIVAIYTNSKATVYFYNGSGTTRAGAAAKNYLRLHNPDPSPSDALDAGYVVEIA